MKRLSGLLLAFLLVSSARAQEFSWFATTMVKAGSSTPHASVVVLPESSWTLSDSTSALTDEASGIIRDARGRGVRVVASVSADAAHFALKNLWAGELDGIIVPAGSLPGSIARPEDSVVLAAQSSEDQVDGSLMRLAWGQPDAGSAAWDTLDSLFAVRAPTMDSPNPAREVAVLDEASAVGHLFLPGSVLLESGQATWEPFLAFRANHPAVGGGVHERLDGMPYAFYRGLRTARDKTDEIVVVMGAEGRTRIKVGRVFEDDTLLRDALTGAMALVSFGQVTFQAAESGILLIEVVD